jgi:hypothetical protein
MAEPLPALVPLTATPQVLGLDALLAGVSVDAMVSCAGVSFRENILFTHRGLSGPAILQISSYWRQGDTILLDLAPERDANAFLLERKQARPKAEAKTVLAEMVPARLAQALAEACLPPGPIANIPDRGRWKRGTFPVSMLSAKRSTSPAGSAATISSGPGRAAGAPGRLFDWSAAASLRLPQAVAKIVDTRGEASCRSKKPSCPRWHAGY